MADETKADDRAAVPAEAEAERARAQAEARRKSLEQLAVVSTVLLNSTILMQN